jgi:hypothetical protein
MKKILVLICLNLAFVPIYAANNCSPESLNPLQIVGLIATIYETFVSVFPTKKNYTISKKIGKMVKFVGESVCEISEHFNIKK